jgi:hypothetical protein
MQVGEGLVGGYDTNMNTPIKMSNNLISSADSPILTDGSAQFMDLQPISQNASANKHGTGNDRNTENVNTPSQFYEETK